MLKLSGQHALGTETSLSPQLPSCSSPPATPFQVLRKPKESVASADTDTSAITKGAETEANLEMPKASWRGLLTNYGRWGIG